MKAKIIVGLLLVMWMMPPVQASAQRFLLVTPNTLPGSSTGNNADVLRFEFKKVGPLTPLTLIPESLLNDPNVPAFNSQGELFVSNRHGNVRGGIGSIARFTFDTKGNFTPTGSITGNGLEAVNGLAFFTTGELFAANFMNRLISRFLFTAGGNAVANGTINTGEFINIGLAFAANGELFTTHDSSVVRRWVFDSITGDAISNGFFVAPGTRLHYLGFDAKGELFVADPGTDRVFRFLFDSSGNPVENGIISVPGGPLGVAFSPRGELFVTSHFTGLISRFVFDDNGNAIPNGSTSAADNLGGVAIFGPLRAKGKKR